MTRLASTLFLIAALAIGCSPGGHLAIRSVTDRDTLLEGGFDSSIYRLDDRGNLTILLLDGPLENPAQAVTIRMLWAPRTARTPLDPGATNASIRYVIFTGENNGRVGVYSGAGYFYPTGRPGQSRITGEIWEASLRLIDGSDGFSDLLGPSQLSGHISALRNDGAMNEALNRLDILVTKRLGYPQYVWVDTGRLVDRIQQ